MPTYLAEILSAHRAAATADRRSLDVLLDEAARSTPPVGFRRALERAPGLSVIAEIKRRSPSRGAIDVGLDPASVARRYAEGGAACLSVLTDAQFFGGGPDDLRRAKAASGLPVLRKDFTVDARDVCDARLMGADAILLIVAGLTDPELQELRAVAHHLGLDVLVEVHDENELERALALEVPDLMVGVNQRDLTSFEVDRSRALTLAARIPGDVVAVAESGIQGTDDARDLAAAGYRAVLVGESLLTAGDRRAAVAALAGTGRSVQPVGAPASTPAAARASRRTLADPPAARPRDGAR
jgi:indole-3-glycerol phosphate synthase